MNTQYLFEAYQKLPKKWQLIFLDTLEFLAEYIRITPKFPGTITESSVEGNDIVLFTYKNWTACWPQVRANFDISNPIELSTLAMMRMGIMEILVEWKVVQKLRIAKESEEYFAKILWLDDESLDYFYTKEEVTWKYIFNPDTIRREWDTIICKWKSLVYSELDEETRKALSFYDKLVSSFGHNELTNIGNLDESYFQWDLYLMSWYNISSLRNMLIDDERKDLIQSIWFENWDILINNKIYHLELRKWGEKAKDFLSLLSQYFSKYTTEQVRITDLVTFAEDEKIKFQQLTTKDIANSKLVKSYLDTFYDNLWKVYWWKPIIFRKKSTVISLEKMKNDLNSSSSESR